MWKLACFQGANCHISRQFVLYLIVSFGIIIPWQECNIVYYAAIFNFIRRPCWIIYLWSGVEKYNFWCVHFFFFWGLYKKVFLRMFPWMHSRVRTKCSWFQAYVSITLVFRYAEIVTSKVIRVSSDKTYRLCYYRLPMSVMEHLHQKIHLTVRYWINKMSLLVNGVLTTLNLYLNISPNNFFKNTFATEIINLMVLPLFSIYLCIEMIMMYILFSCLKLFYI